MWKGLLEKKTERIRRVIWRKTKGIGTKNDGYGVKDKGKIKGRWWGKR